MCKYIYSCTYMFIYISISIHIEDGIGRQDLSKPNRFEQQTAIHCNPLQSTATHCNTLQHTATLYDTLQHRWYLRRRYCSTKSILTPHCNLHRNSLQHTATHCNTLQHTTHCNTLVTHCNTLATYLQHTATHCDTLRHTATHCNRGGICWQNIAE